MSLPPRRFQLRAAACFCAAIGLYELLYLLTQRDGLLIGPRIGTLFPDFLTFLAATRAWLQGKAPMIYDIAAFTQFQNDVFSDQFASQPGFRPFFYPPTWLLMLLPLAALAATKAYAVFMAMTVGLASALAGRRDWWGWLAVLVSPAATWVVIAGQNTFLSVALLYGGLRLLGDSPMAAGILLGLLSYKPQLWFLVPVALVAARQWRALAWMAGTVVVVSLFGVAVFGSDVWHAFLISTREGAAEPAATEMFNTFRNQIVTIFGAARIIGLTPGASNVLQLGAAALAAAAVWFFYRHRGVGEESTALLAAATFFIGPYTMNYDLLLLMPSVVAMFRKGVAQGFRPGEQLLYFLLWLMPTFGWILNQLGAPVMPLAILAFGGCAVATDRATRAPVSPRRR